MTSTEFTYAPDAKTRSMSTQSFGTHRHSDRPASAVRAGASSMPAAWQTRGVSFQNGHSQYGAPARRIGDIAADPFRWAMATKPRKIMVAALVVITALVLIF